MIVVSKFAFVVTRDYSHRATQKIFASKAGKQPSIATPMIFLHLIQNYIQGNTNSTQEN